MRLSRTLAVAFSVVAASALAGCTSSGGGPTSQGSALAGRVVERFERGGATVTVSFHDPYRMAAIGDPAFAAQPTEAQDAAARAYLQRDLVYDAEVAAARGASLGGVALVGDPEVPDGFRAVVRYATRTGFETAPQAPVVLRGTHFADSERPAPDGATSVSYADVRAALLPFIDRVAGRGR